MLRVDFSEAMGVLDNVVEALAPGLDLRRAKRVAMVGALVTLEMAKNLVAATLHLEVSGIYVVVHPVHTPDGGEAARELYRCIVASTLSQFSAHRFAPCRSVTFGSIGRVH